MIIVISCSLVLSSLLQPVPDQMYGVRPRSPPGSSSFDSNNKSVYDEFVMMQTYADIVHSMMNTTIHYNTIPKIFRIDNSNITRASKGLVETPLRRLVGAVDATKWAGSSSADACRFQG